MKNKKPYYAIYKDDKEKSLYRVLDIKKSLVSLSLRDYPDIEQDYYTPKKELIFLDRKKVLIK